MLKGITDKRISKLESNTVEVLIKMFHKDIIEAEQLVEAANLGKFIRKHPIALHDSPYDFAIEILTKVKDYEVIEQYA